MLKKNKNILIILLFSIGILLISRFAGIFTGRIFCGVGTSPLIEKTLYKLFLLILVFISIKYSGNGFAFYGFKQPAKFPYIKIVLVTILIMFISIPLNSIVFMGILRNFIHSNGNFPNSHYSLFAIILLIWLWSSFVEEVFVRGFLQSNLYFLKSKKIKISKLYFSLPVIISAVFFALMHISNIFYGYDILYSFTMIANAFWLGLIASYVRERYDSIYPAVLVHFTANFIGTLPKVIKEIAALF